MDEPKLLYPMIKFQEREKGNKKGRHESWDKKRSPMGRMFLQGEDKKGGTVPRHKFARVYDTWSRNYISSLFLLFPLSTCLSIQPRIWCNFPATSVNCMHFRQRNHQIWCTRIPCPPLCEYIYPLFKKEQAHTVCIYIFRQLYSRKTRMKDSMPRAFFSSFIVKSSVSSFETSFLYLILGNICSNFVFFLLFSFLRRVTREIIYLFHGQGLMYRWCCFDTFHPQDFLFWRVVANNCRNTTFNPNVNPLVYFSLSNEGKEGATASTKIAISL